ncbi:MAG TPA: hypothetical protein ENJ27_02365 [Candidatus Moranbacteria bacterium]|nr:hypothetical protein [Candidatus Moranbacteria bacterium]
MKNYLQSFFWGLIAAGMALVLQIFLTLLFYNNINLNKFEFFSLLFLAFFVLIEESFKYLILVKKISIFSLSKKKLLLNSWFAGIGFSMLEIFILYQKKIIDNIMLDKLALIEIVLLHILTFGILGYITFTKRKINKIRIFVFIFAIHFLYNFSILYLDKLALNIKNIIIIILLIANIGVFFLVNKKLAQE